MLESKRAENAFRGKIKARAMTQVDYTDPNWRQVIKKVVKEQMAEYDPSNPKELTFVIG